MKLIYTGDFERLKEFGFEQRMTYYCLNINKEHYFIEINVYYDKSITIIIGNEYYDNYFEYEIPSVIYDLIKAGLVKKEE